jgi:hypothetical protein
LTTHATHSEGESSLHTPVKQAELGGALIGVHSEFLHAQEWHSVARPQSLALSQNVQSGSSGGQINSAFSMPRICRQPAMSAPRDTSATT